MSKKTAAKDDKTSATARLKTVLVTGANRGIGRGIIEGLLEKKSNLKIVLTARDAEKGQAVYNELLEKYPDFKDKFFFQQLDITSEESISECIGWIKKTFKKIDYIVNNAGISLVGTAFNSETVEETFKTNVYGTIQFTEKMITGDCMNRQGKIIFLSSLGGSALKLKNEKLQESFKNVKTTDDLYKLADKFKDSVANEKVVEDGWFKNAYAVSKLLINIFARALSTRSNVKKDQLSIYSCDPGWTKTDQGGELAPQTIQQAAEKPLFLLSLPDGINKENQGKFFVDNKITPIE